MVVRWVALAWADDVSDKLVMLSFHSDILVAADG